MHNEGHEVQVETSLNLSSAYKHNWQYIIASKE